MFVDPIVVLIIVINFGHALHMCHSFIFGTRGCKFSSNITRRKIGLFLLFNWFSIACRP
jgi:hypothetical protein